MKRSAPFSALLLFLLAAPLAAQERLRLEDPLVPLNAWQLFDDGEASAGPPAPEPPSRMAPGLLCSREGVCEPIIDFSLMRKPSSLMPGRWLSLDVLGGENRLGLGAALDLFGAKGEDGKLPRLRIGLAMSGDFDWTELLGVVSGDPEEEGAEAAPAAERVYQLGVWLAMGLE